MCQKCEHPDCKPTPVREIGQVWSTPAGQEITVVGRLSTGMILVEMTKPSDPCRKGMVESVRSDTPCFYRLVVPKKVRYQNIYDPEKYTTREEADAYERKRKSLQDRSNLSYPKYTRVACIRVEYEEGQFDV